MFVSERNTNGHVMDQPPSDVVEKSVRAGGQDLDVSNDEKKTSNVEVIETTIWPADSVTTAHQQSPQQTVGARIKRVGAVLLKFARFTGPGALISVAYVDPDNYQTALDAGAQFQYKLLFITLLGVLMAIFLQVGFTKLLISEMLMDGRHWQPSWDVLRD